MAVLSPTDGVNSYKRFIIITLPTTCPLTPPIYGGLIGVGVNRRLSNSTVIICQAGSTTLSSVALNVAPGGKMMTQNRTSGAFKPSVELEKFSEKLKIFIRVRAALGKRRETHRVSGGSIKTHRSGICCSDSLV